MNAAPQTRRGEVVVEAGLDARQVEAAWTLHSAFAAEQGATLDAAAWAREVQALAGAWNLGIAWDGDVPVGVVEMHTEYDPMTRQTFAWGKRGYVLPEYRQADVFTAIFEFGVNSAAFLGLDGCRAVANNDWYGKAMQRFYEAKGFKVIGTVMEKS